ncbi:MAG TPA: hypothetical protein VG816_13775 [Solirubrobacterales bacterium]|nr:hypothetical protein [Solirubrobacterales bacterium]
MAREKIDADVSVDAWKGTFDDVAELFERARELANQTNITESDVYTSLSADIPTGELHFDDIGEFRQFGHDGRLDEARKIQGSTSIGFDQLRVSVTVDRRFKRSGGVSTSVSGANPVEVSGIADQLGQALQRGQRRRVSARTLHLVLLFLIVTFSVGAILLSFVSWPATIIAGVLWLATSVANVFSDDILYGLVPNVEILKTDESKTTYERWRGRLLAIGGAVALAIIGAVVQAALSG